MKKILTIFTGFTASVMLTNQSFLPYPVNDKTKNLNIITKNDFNSNEITKLIATYFNNLKTAKQIKNLDINAVKEKTNVILILLLMGCIVDEKEAIKTILTTKSESTDIENLRQFFLLLC